jgi:TetR/AcrR family transcriptional regulator, cholesterol catabolism regulator
MSQIMRTFSENQELVAQRREQIALHSSRLFARNGYYRTTVKEISEACNMPMGMLYHYIGSKEDVLLLVLEQGSVLYQEFFENAGRYVTTLPPAEGLRSAFSEFCRILDKHQDFTVLAFQESVTFPREVRKMLEVWDKQAVDAFEQFLRAGCSTGEFIQHNTALMAQNLLSSAEIWALKRWSLKKLYSVDEYIGQQLEFVINSITRSEHK